MKKVNYKNNTPYIYDPIGHRGAPYSVNGGETWINHGELCEIICKAALGFPAIKDACGAYDTTDDIVELNASVKSSNCTLTSKVLGYDYDSVKAHYFATCHSNLWIYVVEHDDEVVLYYMNRDEFADFMDNFASYKADRKVIRFNKDSIKMMTWLEQRV